MALSTFSLRYDLIIYCLLAVRIQQGISITSRFTQLDECVCPGYNLTFECSILGNGVTVWQGTAFDCGQSSSHQILLSHSRFEGATDSCNNGAIVASSIDIVPASNGDQCFISRLNVTITDAMRNKTIECFHDHSQLSAVIGNTTLMFTTEPYPPPNDLRLVMYAVNPNVLTFTWDLLLSNCSSLSYTISTNNCGNCLPPNSHNTTKCSNVPINRNPCIFSVRTDVCGMMISGRESEPLFVQFKVVDPPTPEIVPHFSCIDQSLTVDVKFNKTDNFNISNGFDGSAFSYTINYSDSTSRETCGSDTIQASDCVGMICTHTLKINPPSSCLSSTAGVSITVIATNALGNGPASDPVVFIIPECDGSSGSGSVAVIASIFTVILLVVGSSTVTLVIVTIILLRKNARIEKELVKAKESSTYEEVDIPTFPTPASIDTAGNISYCPVSRK